jgi:hypothetical protein
MAEQSSIPLEFPVVIAKKPVYNKEVHGKSTQFFSCIPCEKEE